MSYIGNQPATSFETVQKQISTSNSGTTITLDRAVTSVQDILLTIDAVVQSYDNYSVSGTTLTVGGTLSNNRVEILYVGRTMQSVDPTDDSVSAAKIKTDAVTTAKIQTDAVTTAKIQNDAVTVDKLNLISTSSVPSLEAKGTSGVTEGYIQLNCAENSHGIKLKSPPHSAGASYTLTFPNNDGNANQFLQTNGSGVLSFADASGGFVRTGGSQTHTNASTYYIDDVMSDTYRIYRVVGVLRADNTSADIYFRFRGDSSNNLSTSKYIQATNSVAIQSGNSPSSVTGGENTSWNFNYAWIANDSWNDRSTDRYGVHLDWYVYRPDSNQFNACGVIVGSHSYWDYNGGAARFRVNNTSIQYDVSTTPNGFIFYPDSGNMSTIDLNVYGMVGS